MNTLFADEQIIYKDCYDICRALDPKYYIVRYNNKFLDGGIKSIELAKRIIDKHSQEVQDEPPKRNN